MTSCVWSRWAGTGHAGRRRRLRHSRGCNHSRSCSADGDPSRRGGGRVVAHLPFAKHRSRGKICALLLGVDGLPPSLPLMTSTTTNNNNPPPRPRPPGRAVQASSDTVFGNGASDVRAAAGLAGSEITPQAADSGGGALPHATSMRQQVTAAPARTGPERSGRSAPRADDAARFDGFGGRLCGNAG